MKSIYNLLVNIHNSDKPFTINSLHFILHVKLKNESDEYPKHNNLKD